MAAMAADGIIDEESISAAELQTIYGSLTERVNESLSKQESMIGQVQVCTILFLIVFNIHIFILFIAND